MEKAHNQNDARLVGCNTSLNRAVFPDSFCVETLIYLLQ